MIKLCERSSVLTFGGITKRLNDLIDFPDKMVVSPKSGQTVPTVLSVSSTFCPIDVVDPFFIDETEDLFRVYNLEAGDGCRLVIGIARTEFGG